MNSPLVVLVADPYRTEASCAVLSCLQQAERRRGGGRIRFVFNPAEASEPGLLKGASGAVMVLLEGQRAAAETLIRFWEKLTELEEHPVPVLPIYIQAETRSADRGNGAPLIPRASVPVAIVQRDILIEHGGLVSLSSPAESEIEQGLRTVLRKADSTFRTGTTAACPCLKN